MKRTLAVILVSILLLSAVLSAGSVLFAPKSPFELLDKNRESSLSEALGNITEDLSEPMTPLDENGRYVVRFKSDVPLNEIENALNGSDYRLLAESGQRLFAVVPENDGFLNRYSDIIDYSEPDLMREVLAVTNDPVTAPYLETLGVQSAWDITRGKSEVIVAVLDTGIDRTHEDLSEVNILAGYDAVGRVTGVNEDSAGHGTGVIGIIAAAADNSRGIAGVAHGVSILPVKVSSSSTAIYSSDLIAGIRFAADAGAKIINMSVGGYSSSYAEQEAVDYAVSKGCILISAAGNGGNRPYADQKSYPASYEGVISVASCNYDGERSDFSQYNDLVDVAAIGESITMPYVENGVSVYRTDSGTSYSCAVVSGIAALAASQIDESVRFGGDEFLSLIAETCNSNRTDELGHGIINAYQILNIVNLPIITGVNNNATYFESVHAGFNRGTALLNGEPFADGDAIIKNGRHTLTVTDGENAKTVVFRLDYDPLSYKYEEFAAFSYFTFERGSALLDGFPYASGDRITASGRHEFVLTDGDELLTKTIYNQYVPPAVYGIEDGGIYNAPVGIRVVGDGSATLNGEKIYGVAAVAESGRHTLTVTSGNGAVSEQYTFEITFANGQFIKNDYAMASAAVDEANGYICLYGESLVGVRIYDITSPEKFLHFLPVGQIYSHALTEDELLLFGENGVTVIDRAGALDAETAVKNVIFPEGMEYYCFADGKIYCFDSNAMYTLDAESGTALPLFTLGFACKQAFYDSEIFYLADENGKIYTFDGNVLAELCDTASPNGRICFGDGYFAVGNRLYDIITGEAALEFASVNAVKIENGLLFTERCIIDIATGEETGDFAFEVSDIVFGENGKYLFGTEMDYAFISNGAESVAAYGASPNINNAFSDTEEINAYRKTLFYDKNLKIASSASGSESVFVIFDDEHLLYSISADDHTENEPFALKYKPDAVYTSNRFVAVTFRNMPYIFIADENDIANGRYLELPAKCTSVFTTSDRIYAVTGGKLAYFALNGDTVTVTDINAESAILNQGLIYILNGNELSSYLTNLTRINRITVRNGRLSGGNGIAVGSVIYANDLSGEIARTGSEIIAIKRNTVVTKHGVFDLINNEYIGSMGVKTVESAVISPDNSIISFGEGFISVCSFGDESEITSLPVISGISEDSVYLDSAVIEYDRGIGYLDGKPFDSGGTASGAGAHTFTVVLPCGRNISVSFTIEANIERIEFLVGDRVMSVGETVTLRVRYLPDGASSVPVTYSCESDGLMIGEMGELTALKVGVYTVTASVSTDYGSFSAECTVTVRDDLIIFTEESGLNIDRDNGFILGIKAGTSVSELISMLSSNGEAYVVNSEGSAVTDHVGTNDTLVLQNGGETTDSLITVVSGDTDGDGFITAYDLYTLERILRGEEFENAFLLAADVNGNGIVADKDYRDLKNNLLYIVEADLGTPSQNLFGLGTIQTVSRVESGSIIDVVVCISGGKYTRAVSGLINFSEGLEFIEGVSTGWQTDYRELDNRVSFYSFSDDGKECGKAFKVLINLRFRVTAEAGTTVSFSSDGLTSATESGCSIIRFERSELFVYEAQEGKFSFDVLNAYDFSFDVSRREYSVTVPYNSALADISVTKEKGQTVTVSSSVISDLGTADVTVTLSEANGKSIVYTLRVKRDDEPRFDTNCRLSTLEIEGYRLTPPFDPDILSYNLTVPYGTERISIYCTAQSPTASVIIGDTALYGEETDVTITVGSPDGETLKYVIHVFMLPPEDETTVAQSLPEDPDNNIPISKIFIVASGVIAAIALIFVYLHVAKRDEEIKREEEKTE